MTAPFSQKLIWPAFVWCLFFFPLSSPQRHCDVRPASKNAAPAPPSKNEIVIAAVGDVMMPASIQNAAMQYEKGYDLLFEKITSDLAGADITFANLETPVDDAADRAGYPRFNTHPGLLYALKKSGVNVVSLANNHAMDKGAEGLRRTLDNIESSGLVFVGAGRTRAEAEEIKFLKVHGTVVAFLAYTYGTNEALPRKAARTGPAVNVIGTGSEQDLNRAAAGVSRAAKYADLVVVSVHWGEEYTVQPSAWQRRVATALVDAGAAIILGHHPHVLQPIVSMSASDGRAALVAFSLGNFISSQNAGVSYVNKADEKALRGDGIVLTITAVKDGGLTRVDRAEFLPIWTLREPVGNGVLCRPVSLFREIAVLKAKHLKTEIDKDLLRFMSFRHDHIIRTIISRSEKQYL